MEQVVTGNGLPFCSGRAQEFMILAEVDLEEWLRDQGLGQYIPSVLKHTRTGAQLASLSMQDLEEVGGAGEEVGGAGEEVRVEWGRRWVGLGRR